MNRHQRRALARQTATAVPAPESIALVGGPMDGWIVKPDAPSLRADWYRTWPDPAVMPWSPAAKYSPGRYGEVTTDATGVRRATWTDGVHAAR